MKLKIIPIAFILGAGSFANAQGTFVFDQQSTGLVDAGLHYDQTPFGQSFTPTLDSIGFLELQLFDTVAATIDVNIRSGSITGSILGTSQATTIPGNTSGTYDFLFSNPVTLTPGTQYFFEPVVVGGGSSIGEANTTFIQYAGGDAIAGGTTYTDRDLWFREGIVSAVPEPASAALFVVAGSALCWQRRKRRAT
jgi:hypothetical protein